LRDDNDLPEVAVNPLSAEFAIHFGPRFPREDDPRRDDNDPFRKRIDESHTPLPGETDYSDDDDDDQQDNSEDE